MTRQETKKVIVGLQTMLDKIDLLKTGLCNLNTTVNLGSKYYWETVKYIGANPPWYCIKGRVSYYWKKGKIVPRKRWLKRHIKKLKKNTYE